MANSILATVMLPAPLADGPPVGGATARN